MSTQIHKQAIKNIVNWLNEQFPLLAVVMYDIGARYGIHYHYRELLKLKNFSVVGFEPDEQEVAKLKESSQSGIQKIFPVALAESKGVRTIFLTKDPSCSSFYPPAKDVLEEYPPSDFFELVESKSIDTISLDEFTENFDVAQPDFLKMDIQGAEYEVLKGGQLTLGNVVGIFLETHLKELYVGEPLFPESHGMLTKLGFRLIGCEYDADFAGEIIELDLAYVRDINHLETEEKVVKAVLFCLVHKNGDFAAHLIRSSSLPSEKKVQILNLLSQPINSTKMLVKPERAYRKNRVELGKIQEDWNTEPT